MWQPGEIVDAHTKDRIRRVISFDILCRYVFYSILCMGVYNLTWLLHTADRNRPQPMGPREENDT